MDGVGLAPRPASGRLTMALYHRIQLFCLALAGEGGSVAGIGCQLGQRSRTT